MKDLKIILILVLVLLLAFSWGDMIYRQKKHEEEKRQLIEVNNSLKMKVDELEDSNKRLTNSVLHFAKLGG